jgi:1-acyl-sn-glycerol-3-phosphate acyltransferase
MAVKRFNWRWLNFLADIGVIAFIYSIFGVFVIVPGIGIQKNLEEAKRLIGRKQNIVIYPEGKIVTEHIIAPFKPGASILSTETGAPVLPISFHLGERKFIRRQLTVNIGEPIMVSTNAKSDETTKFFYDTIMDLYNKI